MRSSRPWMRLSAGSTNRPETPYIGMPRLRRKRLSVAPVLIDGTTGTPGNLSSVRPSTTFITSARSGEGGLASGGLVALTSTFGPARRRSEERRVGKECRCGWWAEHEEKKKKRLDGAVSAQ